MAEITKSRKTFTAVQGAPRFPIKLPVALKTGTHGKIAETQNISANGVLFRMDADVSGFLGTSTPTTLWDTDDLAGYVKGISEARENRMRFEGDMRLRRNDGSYRWMRTTAVARESDAGEVRGYVSVSVDIEDRKRAEQAVVREGERKDEFLAMLAHELRNPLFPVANAVAVIERSNPEDPKIAWASHVIARQTQQLTRLVDDLMDVARITSGKVALTREPIEVSVLVERARDLSQPLIDGRRQRLNVTFPPRHRTSRATSCGSLRCSATC